MPELNQMTQLIIVGLGMLVAGGVIGLAIGRYQSPNTRAKKEMEDRLEKNQQQMNDYQRQVSEHFAETAKLVQTMNQSYKNVHEHLADSALKLTNPDISRQILDAANNGPLLETELKLSESDVNPPRDWAPKNPGDKGTLREDFGLNESSDEQSSNEQNNPDASKAKEDSLT